MTGTVGTIVGNIRSAFFPASTAQQSSQVQQPPPIINFGPSINTTNQRGGNNTIINQANPVRRLKPNELESFTAAAKIFCSPTIQINATAANSNNEAQVYALDFVKALRDASCKADLALPIPGLRPDITAVHIGIRGSIQSEAQLPAAAKGLASALTAANVGFDYQRMEDNFFPNDQFVLVIGADR